MDNIAKKFLKAVPAFVAGIVVGAVATNSDKVKNALNYGIDTALDKIEDLMRKNGVYREEMDILEDMIPDEEDDSVFYGPEEIIPEEDDMESESDDTPMDRGDWGAT